MKEKEIIEIVKKLRTIYEYSESNKYMVSLGLCAVMLCIKNERFDADIVLNFIKKYSKFKPNKFKSYWFPMGEVKPRLDLLNKTIENYEILSIVKKMRKDYFIGLFYKQDYIKLGFCHLLKHKYYFHQEVFPNDILNFIKEYGNFNNKGMKYWFEEGAILPRLILLNKTIRNFNRL